MALNFLSSIKNLINNYNLLKKGWSEDFLRLNQFNLEQIYANGEVGEPLKNHPTVYMALDAYASNISAVEYKIYKGIDGDEQTSGPIWDLFNRPNSYQCRFRIWEATSLLYLYYGEAFWLFNKSIGQLTKYRTLPSEIHVKNPREFKPIIEDKHLTGWTYDSEDYSLDQLIYFHKYNPFDVRGLKPLHPIKRIIDLDVKALQYNEAFFENGAEMGGYLQTDKSLTNEQYKRLQEDFERRHKGVKNSKRPGILDGGLEYKEAKTTQKDMEFIEQRRYNREEILGIWGVPKIFYSITEDLNYATAQAQKKLFWENRIIPLLKYIEETLNAQFFPKFAPGYLGYFDYSGVNELQEDFNTKLDSANKLFNMGVPLSEINRRFDLGLEEKPEYEVAYLPSNLVPVSELNTPKQEVVPVDNSSSNNKTLDIAGKLLVDKRKKLTHEAFMRAFSKVEVFYASKMKRYFYELRRSLLNDVEKSFSTKSVSDLMSFDWEKFNKHLKKLSVSAVTSAVKTGVNIAKVNIQAAFSEDNFDLKVISYIDSRLNKLTRINDTMKKKVNDIFKDSITQGLSVQDTANKVRDLFNISASKALTIARTEVVGAANGGSNLYMKEVGIAQHQWLTAHDEHVRETHQSLDGEIVDIGKKFRNGLEFPGDDGANKPEESINCRCVTIAVI